MNNFHILQVSAQLNCQIWKQLVANKQHFNNAQYGTISEQR